MLLHSEYLCWDFRYFELSEGSVLPECPVVLTVGLDVPQVEAQALGDVQHVAEVQADGVEEHGGHGDLVQRPHVLPAPRVVRLPPAELHAELTSARRQLNRHDPERQTVRDKDAKEIYRHTGALEFTGAFYCG